jgi:hypothetical protein
LIADQEEYLGAIIDEAHPEVQGKGPEIKFYTPLIPDFNEKTALHLLLE